MKKTLSEILMLAASLCLLAGCIQFHAKAEKGKFVTDESGQVRFVKDEKGKKMGSKKEAEKKKAAMIEEVAVITTAKGVIVFKFFSEDAPIAVENFKKLAGQKFYDNLVFHRVVPGFVIQGGDPKGDGSGGPGYTIKDEFNARPHLEGTVAMARTDQPNSAGSQFYICTDAAPQLDGKYTVFGQVIQGLEVVHKIEKGDVIESIRITSQEVPF